MGILSRGGTDEMADDELSDGTARAESLTKSTDAYARAGVDIAAGNEAVAR